MHFQRRSIDRPWPFLLVAGVLLAAAAPGITRLRLRTDGRALATADAEATRVDRSIREEFGVSDQLAVVVETDLPQGIYNTRTLRHVVDLSRGLAEIPGLAAEDVVSLATEPGDHVLPGTLTPRVWLDPFPAFAAEFEGLRKGIERTAIYRGTLVSTESPPAATAILVRVPEAADRGDLVRAVRAVVAARDLGGDRALVVGAPAAETRLGEHLLEDLARLVPLSFLVMGLILWIGFRSAWMVALPLLGVGASLLATLGLMGWVGAPFYLTCLVLPVILTALGVAHSVHVFDRWIFLARSPGAPDARTSLASAMDDMARPVITSSLTTAIGFLSFAISPLAAVRVFGLAMSAGVILCLLWSLFVLPACLSLLATRGRLHAGAASGGALRERLAPWFASLTRRVLARPLLHGLVLAGVSVAAVIGAARVRVQDSWIEGFSPGNSLRLDTERVDARFGGTHLLRLRVAADAVTAQGEVGRESFDAQSVVLPLPGVGVGLPSSFRDHRLEIVPADAIPGAPVFPLVLRVTDAAEDAAGVRLFVSLTGLPQVAVRDLLPHGVERFRFTLDARDRWREPTMLEEMRLLEERVAGLTQHGVGAVLGPWGHLLGMNTMLGAKPEAARAVLETRHGIARCLDMYARARGAPRLAEVLNSRSDRGLVTVLVRGASYDRVEGLLDELRAYERERLAPLGIRLEMGGDLALSQGMIGGIVQTQVRSILFAVLGIVLTTALLLRSPMAGVFAAIPCAIAVLWDFGVMGWAGIPLGVATSMFAGMTIGVGDDFAIHVWERIRGGGAAAVADDESVIRAMSEAGPSILVDGLAVGAGFSVLVFSQVPPNARLGALLALSILGCLAATFFALPLFLRAMRFRRSRGSRPCSSS